MSWLEKVQAKWDAQQGNPVDEIELIHDPEFATMMHCLHCLAVSQNKLATKFNLTHERIAEMAAKQLHAGQK